MVAEWRNKAENPVGLRRPSLSAHGGYMPIPVTRVRQPFLAKEPLCGTQPANLSLVIAVFGFPSYFVILPLWFWHNKEVRIEEKR